MSSPDLQTGLLANCVARRVSTLADPEHRKLIWFLQYLSHQPGGLDRAAAEMLTLWPERFTTKTMQQIGFEEGRIYEPEEVKKARASMPGIYPFPLRGEMTDSFSLCSRDWSDPSFSESERDRRRARWAKALRSARLHPKNYAAAAFVGECHEAARNFGAFLFQRLCLDPSAEMNTETLWYLPALAETLRDYHAHCVARAAEAAPVTTAIGALVAETLQYALDGRGLVVIDGLARTGKTFAVKAWCEAHPGEARYVQVPSSNDDMSFFRAISSALGLSDSHAYKAHELREKIAGVLCGGDLLLVLDEGHYLWPQRNMRKAVPHRINWLLTQLVNMGVPVAIVTTPQFTKSQEALVQHGGWSSEQFIGRISHYERLPSELAESDLAAVARFWLPTGEEDAIQLLTGYARSSEKYLQGIESLVRRARFLASKAGRGQPTFIDVAEALEGGVVPSDKSLAAALANARPARKAARQSASDARPVQAPCIAISRPMQPSVLQTRETRPTAPQRAARGDAEALLAT